MNLEDLEKFFSKDIFEGQDKPWTEALKSLHKKIVEYKANKDIQNFDFPNTASPALNTLLDGFFLNQAVPPFSPCPYLHWDSFIKTLNEIKKKNGSSIDNPQEKTAKKDLLERIAFFSLEWGKLKAKDISEEIFNKINNYTGGQYDYLSGNSVPMTSGDVIQQLVENAYFVAVWDWMGWMSKNNWQTNWGTVFHGNVPPPHIPKADIIDISTNQGTYKIANIQRDITLLNSALPQKIFNTNTSNVTSEIPDNKPLKCYTVHDLQSYLGAIIDIGNNPATNGTAYVIRILHNANWQGNAGNLQTQIDFSVNPNTGTSAGIIADSATYVFLSNESHYAYPFRIYGHHVVDLWGRKSNQKLPYCHDYQALMQFAKQGLDFNAVKNLVTSGGFLKTVPALGRTNYADVKNSAMGDALKTITVLSANYIAECDRNQAQLLLGLLMLSNNQTTWSKFDGTKSPDFPMGGGGWKNQWSWGEDVNPKILMGYSAQGSGQEIIRWFLNLFFANNNNGFLVSDSKLVKSNITTSILTGSRYFRVSLAQIAPPNLDQIFNNAVRDKFQNAVDNL